MWKSYNPYVTLWMILSLWQKNLISTYLWAHRWSYLYGYNFLSTDLYGQHVRDENCNVTRPIRRRPKKLQLCWRNDKTVCKRARSLWWPEMGQLAGKCCSTSSSSSGLIQKTASSRGRWRADRWGCRWGSLTRCRPSGTSTRVTDS